MADFHQAVEILLRHEGGFASQDNGRGAVNFGITEQTYRELGYPKLDGWPVAVRGLRADQAAEFYRLEFWERQGLHRIDSQRIANLMLSLAVNNGPQTAIKWLQRSCGARDDGLLGPKTAERLALRDEASVIAKIKTEATNRYRALAAANPAKYGDDLRGWLNRLADL